MIKNTLSFLEIPHAQTQYRIDQLNNKLNKIFDIFISKYKKSLTEKHNNAISLFQNSKGEIAACKVMLILGCPTASTYQEMILNLRLLVNYEFLKH